MRRGLPSVREREAVPSRARPVPVSIPGARPEPLRAIRRRVALALGLLLFVALVAYVDRDDYRDSGGGEVGFLDCLYYATVSVTTTGYGDITPITTEARLATTLLVTPARVLFLVLLLSTTIEVLTERTRDQFRRRRWRARTRDHFVICGFGVKGKSAVRVLLRRGVPRERILVIDNSRQAVEEANASGLVAILGSAASTAVLEEAAAARAQAIVVAPERDDTAVLITLTARQIAPRSVTVVAAAREEENAQLLRQSGADSVITSSEAAGRLLGLATEAPRLVRVLEDLLSTGEGLDISEREVRPDEVGSRSKLPPDELIVAVVRDQELLRFDDPRAQALQAGDRLVYLHAGER